ncbi:uncharacterized protein LOC124814334 [Hydra vulgaris]|uniref:uncharacterized protein LOC124814334 n=1 Tax=Hydra vulgaris TaxID=6087 RepID=UPI001F5E5D75|nr:uncharacterized protein LOC124814334 [Hydra vulgaris]
MIHDVNMVYKNIEFVCNDIKTNLPQIKNIEYFSDGCAGQYKNCKNMLNLCFHCEDFGSTAKWNFFATSHGKQPCDGIGGTVKRLATLASLQRDMDNHTLSPQTMYKYCNENIEGINFIFISSEDLTLVRTAFKERLDTANTIPGTRSYHQFVPLGNQKVGTKLCSVDEEFALIHEFGNIQITTVNLVPGNYACVSYEQKWWIGVIEDINLEEKDVLVKFMCPNGPARSFKWPPKESQCWIPVHIICKVEVPITKTGLCYYLAKDDLIIFLNYFPKKVEIFIFMSLLCLTHSFFKYYVL